MWRGHTEGRVTKGLRYHQVMSGRAGVEGAHRGKGDKRT